MRTFKDILSVSQLFIFKLNHKYNLPLHLIIYNNDSVDVLPITSRCIFDQVTKFPIRSRDDEFPIKSRSVPTKCVRSHDVFRTTYEVSDLIRIRIGSEGATDSSNIYWELQVEHLTLKIKPNFAPKKNSPTLGIMLSQVRTKFDPSWDLSNVSCDRAHGRLSCHQETTNNCYRSATFQFAPP